MKTKIKVGLGLVVLLSLAVLTAQINNPTGGGSGTVTSIATTGPITGGTITTTGTVACATCVTSTSPGAGLAHFAGSTQDVTSSAVNLAADVTGKLPIGSVGSAGLSGTSPATISAAGAIGCATCVVASAPGSGIAHFAGSTQTVTSSAVSLTADVSGVLPVANGGVATSTSFATPWSVGSGATSAANKAVLFGYYIPYPVTFSNILYFVQTADNTANVYAIGLYNSAGTLIAHTGPTAGTTFAPTTGLKTIAMVEGSQTIAAGRYYLAFSSVTATAKLGGTSQIYSFVVDNTSFTTAGSTFVTPITPPADSWVVTTIPSFALN